MALSNISKSTKLIYDKFNEIRGKSKADITFRFWDVVVLTASDDEQKLAYEDQISGKLERKEIPSGLPYLVYSDPPGPKIGCGGATMHVIQQLSKMFGAELNEFLVLIINAGGQSQRLPSASVLGKIFTALPYGEPPWSLLELKLACYLPFLSRMKSGFFHIASDTIEVFDVGGIESTDDDWNFFSPGLTALAHPSPLHIGSTHGVFVLEQRLQPITKLAEFRNCVEVLQKPEVSVMFEKGAVIKNTGSACTLVDDEEYVYTDSCFFFDHKMANMLLKFYLDVYPLSCELDGYGDFMQSLGPLATDEFASNVRNVSKVEPSLVETRKKLFSALKGTPLNVITLNASKFYHLGTMRECFDNFDGSSDLSEYIGFVRNAYSVIQNTKESGNSVNAGCTIHSVVTAPCHIGNRSIVEFCDFECPVVVGDDCLISNCTIRSGEILKSVDIPSNLFLHTIELKDDGIRPRCVTIAFHVDDNLKKKVCGSYENALDQLVFLGKPLSKVAKWTDCDLFTTDNSDSHPIFCLWYARLFPVTETKDSSFEATMELVRTALDGGFGREEHNPVRHCISAFEAMQLKDAKKMVHYRNQLFDKIKNLKRTHSI